jgi:16S rRNA (guanine966-N2)-methyltransferase
MRIVAGTHRSRILQTPKNDAIRPTSDKVRGAIFNMLQSRGAVENAIVLDIFCGTGALGLEALSQGAAFCTFIDKSNPSLAITKHNIDALQESERSKTLLADGTKLSQRPDDIAQATLVFLDPPYGKNLAAPALENLTGQQWLSGDCLCVIEEAAPVAAPENFEVMTNKKYGDTHITLLRYIQPL